MGFQVPAASMVALAVLGCVLSGAPTPARAATVRVGAYNIDCSDNGDNTAVTGSTAGLPSVVQAMGQHHLAGNAQPVDVLALTELLDTSNTTVSSTLPAFVDSLNSIYGPGTYAYSATPDPTSSQGSNGPSGLIYKPGTIAVIGTKTLEYSGNSAFTNPRAPVRFELEPVGSTSPFYLYVSHMKAGTASTDATARNDEATILRDDEATLPAGSTVLYTGDYNASTGAAFTTLTGSGEGQALDAATSSTTISQSLTYESESTKSLGHRDDFILMTQPALSGTGALKYVAGSFQVFGNNGTTQSGTATDLPSNTSLNDLSDASTILADMTERSSGQTTPYGSDHLGVVADFNVTATPEPATVGVLGMAAVFLLRRRAARRCV